MGVGSGNAQGHGKEHHSYKNGIKSFHAFSGSARQTIRFCERCAKDLLTARFGEWAVHHRDHDRANNDPSNWSLLCKRCHQREHECWLALRNLKPRRCAVCASEYAPTGPRQLYCSTECRASAQRTPAPPETVYFSPYRDDIPKAA